MIDIVLASYNGGRFIGQQIESLLNQTVTDWRLLIRDDNSTDDTVAICRSFAERHPGKIELVQDSLGRLGVKGNFNELLARSRGEYVMYSDQDDVWLPRKIEISLKSIQELETEYGAATPVLVHTDSRVVDENLEMIAPSLLRYIHRKPNPSLSRLCMEIPMYGHATMFNRALRDLAGRIPDEYVAHDWWHPLVATVFGKVRFVDEATVLFRRYRGTDTMTRKHGLSAYLTRSLGQYHRNVHISFRQCEAFYAKFGARLEPDQKAFFADVCRIRNANWVQRRYLVLRLHLFKTGFIKTLGVLLAV